MNFDDLIVPEPPKPTPRPTEGQQVAIDRLVEAILYPGSYLYKALLEGWAGTGKTWTINRVIEQVKKINPRINVGMTAPTHKAVRQLRKHSELKDQLEFGTIHSFLGLKEVQKPDPKDPQKMIVSYELEWNANQERRIDDIHVLIVDEASMLDDTLYGHIDDVCRNRPDLKVIFMGDNLQIPPVGKKQETGMADAIPFVAAQRQSRKIEHLVLSEVVRQKGDNPIIAYSAAIREQYKQQAIKWSPSVTGESTNAPTTGVEVLRKEHGIQPLRDLFLRYFDTEQFQQDPDYVKVIAWRNATVDYFNREIRLLLNKAETLPKIITGEKLVLDKPVLKGDGKNARIILPNNEELDVIDQYVGEYNMAYKLIDHNAFDSAGSGGIDPTKQHKDHPVKVYFCKVVNPEGKQFEIRILHEDSEGEYQKVRDLLVTAAKKLMRTGDIFGGKEMWSQFYKLEKHFAWAKYNYCLTAHKAQGSTYDYCISMEWDIECNRDVEERNRIRYVGATRARHKLFIVK